MSGLDSPEITAACDAVRDDKNPSINWLLVSDAPTGQKLALAATGNGGLDELSAAFDNTQVQYGFVRIEYANDKESTRVKFVLVVWIGDSAKVMRRARVSVESGLVKRALGHHHLAVTVSDTKDLVEKDLVKSLRSAGGADYNGGRG